MFVNLGVLLQEKCKLVVLQEEYVLKTLTRNASCKIICKKSARSCRILGGKGPFLLHLQELLQDLARSCRMVSTGYS